MPNDLATLSSRSNPGFKLPDSIPLIVLWLHRTACAN